MTDEQLLAPARPVLASAPTGAPTTASAQDAAPVLVPADAPYFTRARGLPAAAAPTAPAALLSPRLVRAHLAACALAAAVLTFFGVLVVSGRVVTEGPVLLVLSRTHGVHEGDLLALACWAAATTGLALQVALVHRAVRRRA